MSLDEATIARLLVREHDKLAAYAWMLVRDGHLVDDILQELALVAIRKRAEIADEAHFLAWMRVACRLTALDALKRRGRRPTALGDAVLDLLDDEWTRHDGETSASTMNALRACIDKLSPYGYQLVELRYSKGWKSSKIAQAMKRDVQTIYVALTRVHRTLAECIRRQTEEEALDG